MVLRLVLILMLVLHPVAFARGVVAAPVSGGASNAIMDAADCPPACPCCGTGEAMACCGCMSAPRLPAAPEPAPAPAPTREATPTFLQPPRPSGVLWPEAGVKPTWTPRVTWLTSQWLVPSCEGLCIWRT